ncbi:MAG: MaoC family dehydratase [Acidobacteriota bacterium]
MVEIDSIAALRDFVGHEVVIGDWFEVSQQRIGQFAEATGDRQWIHVDPERAAAESPFRTTIAHGFLTLSLLSVLADRAIRVGGVRMAINCGLNRVRFTAPVPAGARIRARFLLSAIEEVRRGVEATWDVTIEREESEKPCCLAAWVVRYYE